MKSTTMFVVLCCSAALLGACGEKKTATVQGEANSKLTLTKPSAVSLRRGEMAKVDVKIKRENLLGEVSIRFDDLPTGVSVVDPDNRIVGDKADGTDKATFTLRADDMAALVEKHSARVTATGQRGVSVTETFDITVKERETASGR
jgi:hypothetical protein